MDTFFGYVETPCGDCVDGQCVMNCSDAKFINKHDATRDKRTTYTHLAYIRNNLGHPSAQLWTQDFQHHGNPNKDYLDRDILQVYPLTDQDRIAMTENGLGRYIETATQRHPFK